jgi:threonine aldolase
MQRRSFLSASLAVLQVRAGQAGPEWVHATGDGLSLTSAEFAKVLTEIPDIAPDDYSHGGVVEELEGRMASLLGKEMAVWLPTGTLANQLAVRFLAAGRRRVAVQAESHLFNDCGDCCQTLSGLTLVPLAPGKATFSIADLESAASNSEGGRVPTPIGAIQIETPVRRMRGEQFDFDVMKRVAAWARERKIGLHLDGARLFLESVYTGRSVRDYAALFDTVYISMYKYFNSESGAVLAGPKSLLSNLYHTRRMFGGGLAHVWPFAAVALKNIDGFAERFHKGVQTSEQVIALLGNDSNFAFERIPNGTNVFRMRVFNVNAPVYGMRLDSVNIHAQEPVGDWFTMQVNETWGRVPASEIASRLRRALG